MEILAFGKAKNNGHCDALSTKCAFASGFYIENLNRYEKTYDM